jgi:hypothetical protein
MSAFDLSQILFLLGLACLFFLPTIIAAKKRHPNAIGIFVVNLLFGWSGIAWIFALIWALIAPQASSPQKSRVN